MQVDLIHAEPRKVVFVLWGRAEISNFKRLWARLTDAQCLTTDGAEQSLSSQKNSSLRSLHHKQS